MLWLFSTCVNGVHSECIRLGECCYSYLLGTWPELMVGVLLVSCVCWECGRNVNVTCFRGCYSCLLNVLMVLILRTCDGW